MKSGNDVIVIYSLNCDLHTFLEGQPQFNNHGLLTCYVYLSPFRTYSTFIVARKGQFATHFKGNTNRNSELHSSHPNQDLPFTRLRIFSYCARQSVNGCGLYTCCRIKK